MSGCNSLALRASGCGSLSETRPTAPGLGLAQDRGPPARHCCHHPPPSTLHPPSRLLSVDVPSFHPSIIHHPSSVLHSAVLRSLFCILYSPSPVTPVPHPPILSVALSPQLNADAEDRIPNSDVRLFDAPCWHFVVCCTLYVVCCMMLYVVRCTLYVVCCMLYVVCCMLYAVCCLLCGCTLCGYTVVRLHGCVLLCIVCCMLYVVRCMLYGCMVVPCAVYVVLLYVVCCMLYVV